MIYQQLLVQLSFQTELIGFGVIPIDLVIHAQVVEKQFAFEESKINNPLNPLISSHQSILPAQIFWQTVLILDMYDSISLLVNKYPQSKFGHMRYNVYLPTIVIGI